MTTDENPLPRIEWPETFGPRDGRDVVAAITGIFKERWGIDVRSEGVLVLFVPEPPASGESEDWVRSQLGRPSDLDLERLGWGKRGVAYATGSPRYLDELTAAFLAMRATTLSIIAVAGLGHAPNWRDSAPDLISAFLSGRRPNADAHRYAGLHFDMGVLHAGAASQGL